MRMANQKPPLLSFVVLGYRQFEKTTRSCLTSLAQWIDDPDVEFLVVDNGSPDGSAAQTADWCTQHPPVKYLPSDTNRGFAGGMNWGAAHATGQWLVLVNNDTVFPAHAIDALKAVVSNAPSVVAMLAPVTNAAGNGQRLWSPRNTHAQWLDVGAWLNSHPSGELMPTYRCDFFCVAVRRDVWIQLGGLDTQFGLGYFEDVDFSLRVRAAGYEQMITEDVFVLHAGSATFRANPRTRQLIKHNKKLIQTKHPSVKLEHTRWGNLRVLQQYMALKQAGRWSVALQERMRLRIGALEEDAPRSWLKRWMWKRQVRAVGPLRG